MMRIGYVIYFSSAGCTLWYWRGRRFEPSAVHTPVGVDPGPVVAELVRMDPAPVAVLVDMIDEEHVRDSVPRLGRGDQAALLERRLSRAFPRTAYRAARLQGRNPAKPEENLVLLSGLTRPEPLRILMQRLADARVPVAGIYTPSVLSEGLLDQQARNHPAVFLALRRSNGRWQHSFFREGRLVGSRRLRATAVGVEEDASLFLSQVEESLRYFDPGFSVGADSPLQLLLGSAEHERLVAAGVGGDGWEPRVLPVAELCRRLGIRAALGEDASERWFIELLRRTPPTPGFAPAADQRYCRMFALRSLARVAGFAVAGVALAGALYNALVIADARERAAMSAYTAQSLAAFLPDVMDDTGGKVSPLEMRDTVEAYETLRAGLADPAAILAAISAAVSQNPGIRVEAIEWGPAGPVAGAEPDESLDEEPLEGEATADPAAAMRPGVVTVTVAGRIEPFDGAYPRAFDELQSFMRALRALPAVERVRAAREPLDVNPASTLSGEIARDAAPAQAAFTVEIMMRSGHDTV